MNTALSETNQVLGYLALLAAGVALFAGRDKEIDPERLKNGGAILGGIGIVTSVLTRNSTSTLGKFLNVGSAALIGYGIPAFVVGWTG